MDIFNKRKLKEIRQEKDYYERLCENKNKTINNLNKDKSELNKTINNLISENKKLIEWIEKIIDTVGTLEVKEKTNFKIPIYCKKEYNAYDWNIMGIFEKERIEIPPITIVKKR